MDIFDVIEGDERILQDPTALINTSIAERPLAINCCEGVVRRESLREIEHKRPSDFWLNWAAKPRFAAPDFKGVVEPAVAGGIPALQQAVEHNRSKARIDFQIFRFLSRGGRRRRLRSRAFNPSLRGKLRRRHCRHCLSRRSLIPSRYHGWISPHSLLESL